MANSATSIEPAVLDELNRLGAERGPIASWLEGLEARREDVSESVYRRVREDYAKRIADIDSLARPLRIEATRTIGVLDEQRARLATEKLEVELDLQEVELRHRLEEYTDAELESRAKVPRDRIEKLGLELERIRATRELWLAARGEAIAESTAPATHDSPNATHAASATAFVSIAPSPMSPLAPVAPTAPVTPIASMLAMPAGVELRPVSMTMPRPIPPPQPSSPSTTVPPSADGATRIGDLSSQAPAAPPLPALVAGMDPPPLDRTVVYTPTPPSHESDAGAASLRLQATLVPVEAGDGSAPGHVLAAENTLGRVRENSIQIQHGSVSRHHAILRFTAEGWTLEDLEAENGTWVNGERIEKRRLFDGDRVNIGTVRFIFRIA
ncbi:MAG: FHA domain-containing protein [Thermoanaerobaculia bacterium]